jgi:N-acetylmuramoyl-L-alanine amidase
MSRSALKALSLRSTVVAGGTALLLGLPALPALATTTPPDAPTSATGSVVAYAADLSWTGGTGTGAVVRDVTGLAAPYDPAASGRLVATASATAVHDPGFANLHPTTYAIWSTESDGTPSASPLLQTVSPAAVVPTALALAPLATAPQPYGTAFALAGTATRGGLPLSGQVVDLYGRNGGTSTPVLVRHLRTGADGTVRTTVVPRYSVELSLRFPGDAFSAPSASASRTAQVLPRLGIRLSPAAIVRNETSLLTGQVVPGYSGARVIVQQRVAGGWRSIAAVRTNATGGFSYPLSPGLGVYSYRAVLPAAAGWAQATSTGAALRVDARDLVSGLHGDDVLALQQRLQALHYDVGPVNGTFGYDLTHAVITFQKVERLARTGRWTKAERTRVAHPTAWRVRYPSAGTAVEVDITRQVLVLSRGGVVQQVVDVSTGSERVYYQEGVRNIAHTPRGRYSITRKIDGLHTSPLGLLYRPAFWFEGYAIHGNGSVPATPASHGCVRVTDPVMDRLFPILVEGTPVAVYDE